MFPQFSKTEVHPKVWGREIWICNNEHYCGKILEFNNGATLSVHMHLKKRECWYIKGYFEMVYYDYKSGGQVKTFLKTGDVVELQPGTLHGLKALEDGCSIIEISTQHFEDDSYRISPSQPAVKAINNNFDTNINTPKTIN